MKKVHYKLTLLLIILICLFCAGCGHEASQKELTKLEKQATKYLKKTYPNQTFTVEAVNAKSSGNGLPVIIYQRINATDENGITFTVSHSRKNGWSDNYEAEKERQAQKKVRDADRAVKEQYIYTMNNTQDFWDALDQLQKDAIHSDNISAISYRNIVAYSTFCGTDSDSVQTLTYNTEGIPHVARTTLKFDGGDQECEFQQGIDSSGQIELMEKIQALTPFDPDYPTDVDSVYYNDACVYWVEDATLYYCIVENVLAD